MSRLGFNPATDPRRVFTWNRVSSHIAEWHRRSKSRAELAAFSDVGLQDIGLSRGEATREMGKPFWMA